MVLLGFLSKLLKTARQDYVFVKIDFTLPPILSAIKTPSYNIDKHLVSILEPITTNKFTIKNSFEFAKEAIEQVLDYSWPV